MTEPSAAIEHLLSVLSRMGPKNHPDYKKVIPHCRRRVAESAECLTNTQGLAVANTGTNLIKLRGRKVVEVRDFFFHQERLAQGWNEVQPLTNSPGSP